MENRNNLLEFKKKDITPKKIVEQSVDTGYSFTEEVEKDIRKLQDALDIDRDKAIAIAKDFYRRYPMLMEYVRSPEILLRRD